MKLYYNFCNLSIFYDIILTEMCDMKKTVVILIVSVAIAVVIGCMLFMWVGL
jgi:hypothetical protein